MPMRRVALLLLAISWIGCKRSNPTVAIDVTNKSQAAIKNVEVVYPGGSYGIPSLDVSAVNHHKAEVESKGCVFKLKFEDANGHALGGNEMKLGDVCPPKVSLKVDAQMAVSAEAVP